MKTDLSEPSVPQTPPDNQRSLRTWLKRIGILGFLFFLIKGLAWLFVLWGGARLLGCGG